MKKANVLCIVPSLSKCNGVASYAMNYFRNMKNIKMDFIISNLPTKSEYFEEIISNEGEIFDLSKANCKNFFEYIIKIKNFFKINSKKYDIVHCHVANSGFFFLYYAKKYGIKVRILHSHATITGETFLKKIRNDILLGFSKLNANKYFACSNAAGISMFKEKKFDIIKNAISSEIYEFNEIYKKELKQKYNIKDEFVLGCIGRLCAQKNQMFLLESFHKIKNKDKYKLFLVGSGPMENEVKEKIKQLNLEKYVIMTGVVQDTYKFYSFFDLLVMPSIYEGLPVVGIEAQCNGVPILFSNEITEETKINENVEFLPISNMDLWVEKIENIKLCRDNKTNYFKNSNYNIIHEALKLENKYIELKDE